MWPDSGAGVQEADSLQWLTDPKAASKPRGVFHNTHWALSSWSCILGGHVSIRQTSPSLLSVLSWEGATGIPYRKRTVVLVLLLIDPAASLLHCVRGVWRMFRQKVQEKVSSAPDRYRQGSSPLSPFWLSWDVQQNAGLPCTSAGTVLRESLHWLSEFTRTPQWRTDPR